MKNITHASLVTVLGIASAADAGVLTYSNRSLAAGVVTGGVEKVLRAATDLVCGDVLVVDGQSNALATDFGEPAPTYTSEWIRPFGSTSGARGGCTILGSRYALVVAGEA